MKLKAGAIPTDGLLLLQQEVEIKTAVSSSVKIQSEQLRRSAFEKRERCSIRLAWQSHEVHSNSMHVMVQVMLLSNPLPSEVQ